MEKIIDDSLHECENLEKIIQLFKEKLEKTK
jgi:hypothetical protein